VRIKIDTSAARKQLTGMERQIPFAKAAAVNDLAFQVQRAENDAMKEIFHRPRPFTQKATAVRKATKSAPAALVFLKPAQERYLAPYENGGLHALPGKALLEPIEVRLDAYGQMPKGTAAKLAGRPDVFVGKVKNVAGFWQRLKNGHLRLLIRFGVNKPVTKRLNFERRAVALVKAKGAAAMQRAITKAIATARR